MRFLTASAIFTVFFCSSASADIILYSGNGTVGSTDSKVTFLDSNSSTTDFSSALTTGNFTSARTGPAANIISGYGCPALWVCSLPDGPGAQWINTTGNNATGDTALFAISFTTGALTSSSLQLYYAADNQFGGNNAGIYLDGVALPSSTGVGIYNAESTYTDASLGALSAGTHTLYIDGVNGGGPGGVIFYADIAGVAASGAPEPGSILLMLGGIAGIAAARLRRARS